MQKRSIIGFRYLTFLNIESTLLHFVALFVLCCTLHSVPHEKEHFVALQSAAVALRGSITSPIGPALLGRPPACSLVIHFLYFCVCARYWFLDLVGALHHYLLDRFLVFELCSMSMCIFLFRLGGRLGGWNYKASAFSALGWNLGSLFSRKTRSKAFSETPRTKGSKSV